MLLGLAAGHSVADLAQGRQGTARALSGFISSSPTDIQPVLETIGERAEKLCDAEISVVSIVDGELVRLASIHGMTEAGVEAARRAWPMRRTDETVTARAIRPLIATIPSIDSIRN